MQNEDLDFLKSNIFHYFVFHVGVRRLSLRLPRFISTGCTPRVHQFICDKSATAGVTQHAGCRLGLQNENLVFTKFRSRGCRCWQTHRGLVIGLCVNLVAGSDDCHIGSRNCADIKNGAKPRTASRHHTVQHPHFEPYGLFRVSCMTGLCKPLPMNRLSAPQYRILQKKQRPMVMTTRYLGADHNP